MERKQQPQHGGGNTAPTTTTTIRQQQHPLPPRHHSTVDPAAAYHHHDHNRDEMLSTLALPTLASSKLEAVGSPAGTQQRGIRPYSPPKGRDGIINSRDYYSHQQQQYLHLKQQQEEQPWHEEHEEEEVQQQYEMSSSGTKQYTSSWDQTIQKEIEEARKAAAATTTTSRTAGSADHHPIGMDQYIQNLLDEALKIKQQQEEQQLQLDQEDHQQHDGVVNHHHHHATTYYSAGGNTNFHMQRRTTEEVIALANATLAKRSATTASTTSNNNRTKSLSPPRRRRGNEPTGNGDDQMIRAARASSAQRSGRSGIGVGRTGGAAVLEHGTQFTNNGIATAIVRKNRAQDGDPEDAFLNNDGRDRSLSINAAISGGGSRKDETMERYANNDTQITHNLCQTPSTMQEQIEVMEIFDGSSQDNNSTGQRPARNNKKVVINPRATSMSLSSPSLLSIGHCDEKKDADLDVGHQQQQHQPTREQQHQPEHIMMTRSLSMTESDVGSVDGLPTSLQSRWSQDDDRRERMLKNLDGIMSPPALRRRLSMQQTEQSKKKDTASASFEEQDGNSRRNVVSSQLIRRNAGGDNVGNNSRDSKKDTRSSSVRSGGLFGGWSLNIFGCGNNSSKSLEEEEADEEERQPGFCRQDEGEETLALLLGCSNIIHHHREKRVPPVVPTSLVRVTTVPLPPSYAETIHASEVDPRLQDWVDSQYMTRDKAPKDGSFFLGRSRTVIVHEIARGSWTWCTAWSPEGDFLAVATENHHLTVVDTTSSIVWRVKHDQKIVGPPRKDTTHSIRSIAWGTEYIAIGGTGNAVSIVAPREPYTIIHTIRDTGFVGSLDWRVNSNVLAIGSRLDKAIIVRIRALDEHGAGGPEVEGEILQTIGCKDWANSVAFSPGGTCLAIGEGGGVVSVYSYLDDGPTDSVELSHIKSFTMDDSVLVVEWSPDGKWLYAGGEDFHVSVIDTNYWEVVHKIRRNRWVQCISSSKSGTHLAVGGVSSEISILDVKNGWESVMGVELKGLVPLSANWHPKDQFLAVTGQDNSILVVETTNARHVNGHHLYSVSPIVAIEFSPDGRIAAIGNENGIVTFFSLSGSTFVTAYELVVALSDKISIRWSLNGMFAVVGTRDAIIIVGKNDLTRASRGGVDSFDKRRPPEVSGFSVLKVIRDFTEVQAIAVNAQSDYIAVCGVMTWIVDVRKDFAKVKEWKNGMCLATQWSPDGSWLATIGAGKVLTIYDTQESRVDRWCPIFSLQCDFVGHALAWGPLQYAGTTGGRLLYLAYGGDNNEITIMEIRTHEGTWETVLRIPRDGSINALDWSHDGLLAAAVGNGTVCVANVSYLQAGIAVNEMNYNWQRQALTCFTEVRRNRGKNVMKSVKWIPSAPGSDSLLAIGGSDGEVEIIDLTERARCRGYVRGA